MAESPPRPPSAMPSLGRTDFSATTELIVCVIFVIMANTVSENIRKLRQKKGISQDRLSKDADIALNTVVKIETGENPNPTVDTLEKIAKALGVSMAELFK